MEDDDWLDSGADESQNQVRLAENERNARMQQEWNQGYLTGLEWADENYQNVDLTTDDDYQQVLREGIQNGVQ